MPYGWMSLAIVFLPFVASVAMPLVARRKRRRNTWIMVGTATVCLVLSALLYRVVGDGVVVRQTLPWAPAMGLEFILRTDGLAWLFQILVCGIGVLVGIYATYYMPPEYPLTRFFSLLLAFMGSMLGIVMSGNVIQLVFFWELTSIFSFLLIGYWHHGESARDAARTALIVTAGGGLCLLAGVLLLGHMAGSYNLDVILASADQIRGSPLYLPMLVLILVGAFSKSALFPFHFWLPQAMSAPTPVSAYLHSATMVKAGVFVLLRFWPVLAGTSPWFWLVGGAGLVTMLLGAWAATFQHDLKAILAYSTISHLGLIAMLLGLGSTLGAVAAIFHVVNHATFKASLFMAAGAVDHETGTRDLRRLGGLRHVMPITTALALISGAAMAGVPLLNGFLSKEMFFAATLGTHNGPVVDTATVVVAVAATALGVAYSARLLVGTFFGPLRHDYPRTPHEPPRWMRFPVGFLALACLAVGIFPARVIGHPLQTAARSVLGTRVPAYDLAIWHGLTAPLVMSVIAFAAGFALYFGLRRFAAGRNATRFITWTSAMQLFERALAFLTGTLPRWQQKVFPSRRLQVQLLVIVVVAGIAAIAGMSGWQGRFALRGTPVDPAFALLWLLGAVCAIAAAALAKFHRLAAMVMAGGAGLVVCVTFVWLSAPDLAATQVLVESVTAILLLLGLRWLPKRVAGLEPNDRWSRHRRYRDLVIAIIVGVGLAGLAYLSMLHAAPDSVSQYFLREALPGGGGRNVVNVILVDFRSFDTLGEITVLAIVALTVYALLRRFRPAAESIRVHDRHSDATPDGAGTDQGTPAADARIATGSLAVPALAITLIAPIIALFGVHLFVRGHNLPGGGFVAGITVAVALIALYIGHGARWVEARLHVAPTRWIGIGLLVAVATGVGSIVVRHPFLTSYSNHFHVPWLGEVPVTSALLFDLGVFGVVVGATSLILVALGHQSLRRPVAPPEDAPETGDNH